MKRGALLLLAIWIVLPGGAVAAPVDPASMLIAQARERGLAQTEKWRALGHYLARPFGGWKSVIDDPGFFIHPEGKTDPRAELEETIRAFLDGRTFRKERSAACTYPARYTWLAQKLDFAAAGLEEPFCPDLLEWLSLIKPHSMTLVYPASYMNNPASMFGHTFLRVDPAGTNGADTLLSYAINFMAEVSPDENGVVFAVRGLIGLYPAYYGLAPYYMKVNEYNDIEDRDIWEYPLNYTPDEVLYMMLHMWELLKRRVDYYFLDENCSYQLLGLLEVVRPELDLRERFPLQVVPADTMRVVLEEHPGSDPAFRPSLGTTLTAQSEQVDERILEWTRRLAAGDAEPDDPAFETLKPGEQAAALELAHDTIRFEFLEGDRPRDPALKRARLMLLRRAKIDGDAGWKPVPKPAVDPVNGHDTGRIGFGGRWPDDGPGTATLNFRWVFHDLLDPPGGYVEGAQISVADTVMRLVPDRDAPLRVERFRLVDIFSLAPQTPLFTPLSWSVRTQVRQRYLEVEDEDTDETLLRERPVIENRGGAGLAWGTPAGIVYAMLEAEFDLHEQLPDRYLLGPGASVGWLLHAADWMSIHLTYRHDEMVLPESHRRMQGRLETRIDLDANSALRLETQWLREFDETQTTVAAHLHLYY